VSDFVELLFEVDELPVRLLEVVVVRVWELLESVVERV
jgi:hypothetical protein